MSAVPPVDLRLQHEAIAEEVREGFAALFDKTAFILGPAVTAFEAAYASFIGARHCIGVANGTDALELALRAAGVDADTEVLLPVNTFIATALAVLRAGARPLLVDCDPDFYLLDVEQAAARVTKRTRFLMPVHLYGQMAPVERIDALAKAHGLTVIEDAAQAQGARRHGRAAGTLRSRRRDQLLSGEEPGRLRRRGRDHHRLRPARRARARAPQLRQRGEVPPPRDRLQLAPRHAAGGRAPRQAQAPRRLERSAAPGRRGATTSSAPTFPR